MEVRSFPFPAMDSAHTTMYAAGGNLHYTYAPHALCTSFVNLGSVKRRPVAPRPGAACKRKLCNICYHVI